MESNTLIAALFLLAVAAVFGAKLWMRSRSRALQGKQAPKLRGRLGEVASGDALLYFHSPGCAPCRAMAPQVEELAQTDQRVHSVDVAQTMEAAQAFGLMGTPTVIAIRNGKVQRVQIGAMSNAALREMLTELDD
jgi:thioredoxin 1